MQHPLDSARERLKRAYQNIGNLKGAIDSFIDALPSIDFEGENPIWSDHDREAFEKIQESIRNTPVDPQWKVAAGEIIHHLRSAFDHVAWQLSSAEYRRYYPTRIEFPVFYDDPASDPKKNKPREYERKVKGIKSETALRRIRELQPYSRPNPSRNPLWLIHDLDRIDKHRELVIVVHTLNLNIRADVLYQAVGVHYPHEIIPRIIQSAIPTDIKYRGKISTQIAFRETGKGEPEAVIPLLQQLTDFTRDIVESFVSDF